jgi:serine/threonine protein kinase
LFFGPLGNCISLYSDIKTANILLDASGNAKVADFGTVHEGVKQGGSEGTRLTHASTKLIVGTHFYMSPEYTANGQVSEKLDSYAFAIVLLELLTGKPPSAVAALNIEEPDVYAEMQQYVDGRAGAWAPAVVHRLAAVAERCIEFRPRTRASVRDVVDELEELELELLALFTGERHTAH